MREALRGGSRGIAGEDERLATHLIHARHGIGLHSFPQILCYQAPASGQAMSSSILGGAQSVSSVDMKSQVTVGLTALMANQLTTTTLNHAKPAVAVWRTDLQGHSHHDLPTQPISGRRKSEATAISALRRNAASYRSSIPTTGFINSGDVSDGGCPEFRGTSVAAR